MKATEPRLPSVELIDELISPGAQPTLDALMTGKQRLLDALTQIAFLTSAYGGGPVLSDDDLGSVQLVRPFEYRQSPMRNLGTGDTLAWDPAKMTFALCSNFDRNNNANASQNGNAIVITHVGLYLADDTDRAVYAQMRRLGSFSINGPQGSNMQQISNRPLGSLLVADGFQNGQPSDAVAIPADGTAVTVARGIAALGLPSIPPIDVPFLVRSSNAGKLQLAGLEGPVDGDPEAVNVALCLRGYELVGLTK